MLETNLRSQYQILASLRKIDEKIFRISREIDRIPIQIDKLKATLATKQQDFDKIRQEAEGHEKKQRQLESELKEFEEKLRKAEGKMMEVRTNEEYKAAAKEIEGQKAEKSGIEDRVLSLISQTESEKLKVKEAEKMYKESESITQKECAEFEKENTRLSRQLEEQLQIRLQILSQLSSDVAALYDRVSSRIKDSPIIEMENTMCLGCNIKIRPQLYNEILGFKEIHRCPNCARILITAPTEDRPDIAETSK